MRRPIDLEPYSSEWFEWMLKRNPKQALMTGAVRARSTSENICAICGDLAVGDFAWSRDEAPVRLCADCREIQEGMYGGILYPVEQLRREGT